MRGTAGSVPIGEESTPKNKRPKSAAMRAKARGMPVGTRISGAGEYDLSAFAKSVKDVAKSAVKSALIAGGGAAGGVVGSKFGMGLAGKQLGNALGAKMSRILGGGDYTVNNEVAVNALMRGTGTRVSADANASFASTNSSVRVRHREFIQDVLTGPTAGAFNNLSLPVNPGLPGVFPYLASIAQNFEEYKFHGLVFEFVSTTSPYNSNSAIGSVIMAMEYNPLTTPFNSKPQMENSDYAVSMRFDKCAMYGVECSEFLQNMYFVRYSATSPLSAYDVGSFQIATAPASTFSASSVIGELWVSYDIELMRPRICPARYGLYHWYGSPIAGGATTLPNYTAKSMIGTLSNVTQSGNLFTLIDVNQGDVYLINVNFYAVQAVNTYTTLTLGTGLGDFTWYGGGGSAGIANFSNNASLATAGVLRSGVQQSVVVTGATGSNVTITVNFTNGASANSCDVVIVNLGNGYANTI